MSSSAADRPTIPIRYLIDVIERRRRDPRAIARAIEAASISERMLESPRMRVSITQYERFHAVLAADGDDELFGFFARPVPIGAYATLLSLLTGARELGAALESAGRFYRLFDRHTYWRWDFEGPLATLSLVPRDQGQERSVFFVHSMLLAPWRTACWLSGQVLSLERVKIPPRFRRFESEARYLFGCEPRFEAGLASITMRSEILRLPTARTRREADAYARISLRELLLGPSPSTIPSRLRALLASSKPFADLPLSQAARSLGCSRATLARKLAEVGLSFQRVKDELRRDQAITLLTGTSLPIAEIAERLGYSAPSAFQRAFREWTGVAPGELRRSRSRPSSPRAARS